MVTFPWMTPIWNASSILAPARYAGLAGPVRLLVNRLTIRWWAIAWTTQRCMPRPPGWKGGCRLRSAVVRAISSRRRIVSGSPTGSGTIIAPTRLPEVSASPWARMETGTMARRRSPGASSARLASRARAPPATAASTTSFTVAPCAWATCLARCRSPRTSRRRRCSPTARFSDDRRATRAKQSPELGGVGLQTPDGLDWVAEWGANGSRRGPVVVKVVGEQVPRRWRGSGRPGRRDRARRVWSKVEHRSEERQGGGPVGDHMMQAQEHRHVAAGQPGQQPQFPQGARPVQWSLVQLHTGVQQRCLIARRRDGASPNVPLDVEARIADPHRRSEPETRLVEHLAQARRQMQTFLDPRPHLVQPSQTLRTAQRSPIEDGERGDVHWQPAGLYPQVAEVLRAQPVESAGLNASTRSPHPRLRSATPCPPADHARRPPLPPFGREHRKERRRQMNDDRYSPAEQHPVEPPSAVRPTRGPVGQEQPGVDHREHEQVHVQPLERPGPLAGLLVRRVTGRGPVRGSGAAGFQLHRHPVHLPRPP